MALTGSLNGAWDDGVIQTMTEMRNDIQGQTYTGADRTNAATDTTFATIATSSPSSPKTGELWIDSSSLTGAPAVRARVYNGSEWIGVGVIYSTSAPSSTTTGILWYDMTLELLRMYRSATEDLHGIAGWHPVSDAYQLWTNKSGGTVSANRVVVQYTATAVERAFTTSTNPKDGSVIGVTMQEATSDGTAYVIALVAGGAFVDIYCNVTAANVALGDFITVSSVAGEGRTVGSVAGNPKATAATFVSGVPYGAFAVAQAAITSAGLVACRMLGFVGSGAVYRKASTTIASFTDGLANAQWNGDWDPVDVASYPPGVGGNDFIATAAHKPILGVFLCVDASVDSTDAGTVALALNLDLGPDGATSHANVHMDGSHNNNGDLGMQASDIFVPTSAGTGTPTVLGNLFYWSGTKSAGAGTAAVRTANFRAIGYIW